jgi:hypothetical protein
MHAIKFLLIMQHEANHWDSYEWALWEQPLVREAVRLRGLRTDYVVQSPVSLITCFDGCKLTL